MIKRIINTAKFSLLLGGALLVGCNHKDDPTPEPEPDPVVAENTVIVYMVADNNLSNYATSNINMMERAIDTEAGQRVLIFYNNISGQSKILEVVSDQSTAVVSKTLYSYPAGTSPVDPATLSDAIERCREFSPTEKYSLLFWSHATGWLPEGMHPANSPASPERTFGSCYNFDGQMEINELAAALPDDVCFEYIYFDACYMGSVEAAYEVRDNAKYYISSAAEVLANGYPYDTGFKAIVDGDAVGIAKNFFEHYNNQSGVLQSATISAVDLSKIGLVAEEFAKLPRDVEPTATQQFGRNLGSRNNYKDLLWDLGDMLQSTWGEDATAVEEALDEAIAYKGATERLFAGDMYGTIEVDTFSGLTIYIPRFSQPETLELYKNNYQWAKDTEFYELAY